MSAIRAFISAICPARESKELLDFTAKECAEEPVVAENSCIDTFEKVEQSENAAVSCSAEVPLRASAFSRFRTNSQA